MTRAERRRNRQAARRLRREVPRAETRRLISIGMAALDASWAAWDVPILAVVVERGGLAAVRVSAIAGTLGEFDRVAGLGEYVHGLERARTITAADGIVLVLPAKGEPAGCIASRPGRQLADEDLDELIDLAISRPNAAVGLA